MTGHPGADAEWLKRKIDAGAGSAITRFFFELDTFLCFRDACAQAGITAPILPGILLDDGVEDLHFNTLNRPHLSRTSASPLARAAPMNAA